MEEEKKERTEREKFLDESCENLIKFKAKLNRWAKDGSMTGPKKMPVEIPIFPLEYFLYCRK